MHITTHNMAIQRNARKLLQSVLLVPLVVVLASLQAPKAHAAGGFTFLPIGGTYTVGQSLTVSIHENSGTDPTNAVSVEFTYPTDKLQYVSGDASDSAFEVSALDSGGNGTVSYQRGTTKPVTGDQLVERAVFKVVGSGTAVLEFDNNTVAVSSTDNKTDVATDKGNASFTLNPQPSSGPTTGPTNPAAPGPSSGSGTTTHPKATPTIRVTPVASNGTPLPDSIPLSDRSVVELDSPADVQPATIQPDGISKVEYYLDSRLVKTATVAPYTYRLQTTDLLNGKYTLTTKTYYTNGQTETTAQTVIVNNPFGWAQFRLWLQKYILVVILAIFLVIAVIVALIIKKNMGQGGGDVYQDVDETYITPPPAASITPSAGSN